MGFTLPKAFSILQKAETFYIGETALRFRLPTARDQIWASSYGDNDTTGINSNRSKYSAAILAVALIGIDGRPLTELCKGNEELSNLVQQSPQDMTQEDFEILANEKLKLLQTLPSQALLKLYIEDFDPWVTNSNIILEKEDLTIPEASKDESL